MCLQILWLCRELVKNAAPGADSVCHSLLRQIAGGDVSQKNIWLTESMLDIFMEHRCAQSFDNYTLARKLWSAYPIIKVGFSSSAFNLRCT